MHTSRWSNYCALLLGKDCLVTLCILWLNGLAHPAWQWSLAKTIKGLLKLLIATIIEEAQSTTTRGCIVNNLCTKDIILAKVELITNTNLTSRVYKHIPQTKLLIELTKQENLNLGASLLLISIESCREDLCVVKHKAVLLLKILQNILKNTMFNLARILVKHKQA